MDRDVEFDDAMGGKPQRREIDFEIGALAARQHGVVARRQLMALGIGPRAIDRRLQRGRLHPLHRAVYAVGHRLLSRDGRWMAAVLAMGPEAVLSHRSAAALWGMRATARTRIEVTVPGPRRSRPAIQAHRASLAADEVTVARNIPVTTPPRTLLDLAAVVGRFTVERAVDEAEVLRLTDAVSLAELVARHGHSRGAGSMRKIMSTGLIGARITRSELEDHFLAFLDRAGLPRPEVNVLLPTDDGPIEVDCVWRAQRVIVELDGHASHGTRAGFERDRARDRALAADGWRVIRITWRQLAVDAIALARDLARLLLRVRVT